MKQEKETAEEVEMRMRWLVEDRDKELERLREDKEHLELECDELVHEKERLRGVIDMLLRDGLLYPEGVKALRDALGEKA